MTITPTEYMDAVEKLLSLEVQVKEANRLIAEFANGANAAHDTITQLQSELAECKRREAVLLTAIQRIKNWDFNLGEPISSTVSIAGKAWDEARPKNQTPAETGA